MTPTTTIPQELIGRIIDQLKGDPDSLKICAVVSRSFLFPCRKHLFRAINLHDSLISLERLYNVLSSQPDIALLIRECYIFVGDFGGLCEWMAEDIFLPDILDMIHHLELIYIYGSLHPLLSVWDTIPIDIRYALLDRFQSPSLTEVVFDDIGAIPISVITALTHVRRLRLIQVALQDDFVVSELEQLAALDLKTCGRSLPAQLLIQNLRLLYIRSNDDVNLYSAYNVISSSANSIKTVIWSYSGLESRDVKIIKLDMICNLELLLLGMHLPQGSYESRFANDLASLVEQLEVGMPKTLKEITLAVTVSGYTHWNDALLPLSTCEEWDMLDEVIWSQCPALRKVQILVDLRDIDSPAEAYERLCFLMSKPLPRLAERGILSLGFGNFDDVGQALYSAC